MTGKELRRMSRSQLIEIIYELKKREDDYKMQIDLLQQKLNERVLCMESAGSIAQASMQLNRVFEAAQAAADQYLLSVRAAAEAAAEKADQTEA